MLKVVTNKFISEEDAKKIKEVIEMTKIDRIFEEEKQKAIAEKVAEKEAEKQKAIEEKEKMEKERIARNMLDMGDSDEKVAICVGYTVEQVRALAARA